MSVLDNDDRRPIAAVATRSPKTNNEDAGKVLSHLTLPVAGVVVADGLGSHHGAHIASDTAVRALAASIEAASDLTANAMPVFFEAARTSISNDVSKRMSNLPDGLNLDEAFGTTLLCGLDLPDRFVMAYVGNGAMIHLRANFIEFPPTRLLPWSATNCLNPHASPDQRLYKWLGPRTCPTQSTPTIVEIAKDNLVSGDILIVCSDGIYSLDHAQVGWAQVSLDVPRKRFVDTESVAILYEHLRAFVAGAPLTSEALHECLDNYLMELDARKELSDDCTVGVIVTAAALRYYEGGRSQGRRIFE
jgi:serine/threonine protein phosphatase PrpC